MSVNGFCRLSVRLSLAYFVYPVRAKTNAPPTRSFFGPACAGRSPQSERAIAMLFQKF